MTVTLYQAGAGSGKTYTIAKEITARLAAGEVQPEGILATTFTRKAAAELRDRIRSRILAPEPGDPKMDPATRIHVATALDGALIGTLHSVGFQLLQRYALHLGLSPRLEPVEENAQERHLRNVLAEMDPRLWEEFGELAQRLGLADEQELGLKLLEEKRTNRIPDEDFVRQLREGGERYIQVLAPAGPEAAPPTWGDLYEAMSDVRTRLAAITDTTQVTKAALEALDSMRRSRRRTWSDWGRAAGLKAGRTSGANVELDSIRALASSVRRHPELHQDLRDFLDRAARLTLALGRAYQDYKARHGLLDFTDQEELFLQLLENPDVRADLAEGIEILVVDEFQDTNPIQLAIFQELRAIACESIWVGDKKQAIYGFRGTDARLMEEVLATVPEEGRKRLPENWRSRPGLVHLVNRIFEPILPGASLEPARNEDGSLARDGPSRVERWRVPTRSNVQAFGALAEGIRSLREAGTPLRDIAVLVRTNNHAENVGKELRRLGIPVVVKVPGLLSTREGLLALSGIRYVADRFDAVAVAQIRHLIEDSGDTPAWLMDRIADLGRAEGEEAMWATSHVFRRLDAVPARTLGPAGVMTEIIQALRLPDLVAAWGEPDRRSADLDELVRLAATYEEEARQDGKAPTVTGLISWLAELAREGPDNKKPEDYLPVPEGVDAVTVMTVHAAKGLEWPTVILYLHERRRDPAWYDVQVGGGDASHGKPLSGRWVRLWPYPFGISPFGAPANDGVALGQAVLGSPEGLDLATRDQEEARRLLYVAMTRARDRLILVHGNDEPTSLKDVQAATHLSIATGEMDLGDGLTYAVREMQPGTAAAAEPGPVPWFAGRQGPGDHVARYWAPGKAPPVEGAAAQAEPLPGEHPFQKLREVDWERLGKAVHAYLASLPAIRGLKDEVKGTHAEACLQRWGPFKGVSAAQLVAAGKRLEMWVQVKYPDAVWHVEVPVTGPRDEGGQWVGAIDLVIDGPKGPVVFDHKSADYDEGGWEEKALEYSGQVRCYVRLLGGAEGAVHLSLGGAVVAIS